MGKIRFDTSPINYSADEWKRIKIGNTPGLGTMYQGILIGAARDGGGRPHGGIDIGQTVFGRNAASGMTVSSVAPGTVIAAFVNTKVCGTGVHILHNEIDSKYKYITVHCHLSSKEVQQGATVQAGQRIGKIGDTGNATGQPHLHFGVFIVPKSIRDSNTDFTNYDINYMVAVDPLTFLKNIGDAVEVSYGVTAASEFARRSPMVRRNTFHPGTAPLIESSAAPTRRRDSNLTVRPGVTPYIASLESFHPHIQYELSRRRLSTETANTYYPFVKLTSLLKVTNENSQLGEGGEAWCPTLGIHGQDVVSYQEMYTPTTSQPNRSIFAYASALTSNETDAKPSLIPLYTDIKDAPVDPPNIPPPGIVGVTTEKSTTGPMGIRGGLMKANIKIVAYSVGQLNALLRYMLRPGTRVVLEFGRNASSEHEKQLKRELANAKFPSSVYEVDYPYFQKFDWTQDLSDIITELGPLIYLQQSQTPFIEKYVYGNFGNYEIYIAYVVNFKVKYGKANTYEIDLTVHSVQQFEVPNKNSGATSLSCGGTSGILNSCKPLDISDYFNPSTGWKGNSFYSVLKAVNDGAILPNYRNHVYKLPIVADSSEQQLDKGFLISWKFFVDVILNNSTYGVLNLIDTQNQSTINFIKGSLIKPVGVYSKNSKVHPNEVSYDVSLITTDPSVMLIINESKGSNPVECNDSLSVDLCRVATQWDTNLNSSIANNTLLDAIAGTGTYAAEVGKFKPNNNGHGNLSEGVWLNSSAISEAFTSTDTLSAGIHKLLTAMNNATEGFWNLQLLSNETDFPGMHVVDMGLSKTPTDKMKVKQQNQNAPTPLNEDILDIRETIDSTKVQQDIRNFGTETLEPKHLYLFNRKLKTFYTSSNDTTGIDSGGELLDINVDIALPQVIAIQAIAGVGGVAQRGVLEAINIEELRDLSLFPNMYAECRPVTNTPCNTQQQTYIDTNALTSYGVSENDLRTVILRLKDEQNLNTILEDNAAGKENPILEGYVTQVYEKTDIFAQDEKLREEYNLIAFSYGISQTDLERGEISGLFGVKLTDDPRIKKILVERQKIRLYLRLTGSDLLNKIRTLLVNELGQTQTVFRETNADSLNLIEAWGQRLGNVLFKFVAVDKRSFMKVLDQRGTAGNNAPSSVHPFSSSNLTKTVVDLTLPGIGGIQLFQSFAVDRVPNILERGYYVVTKIAHEFTIERGWITKIQGRFRYNPNQELSREQRREQ